MKQIHKLTGYDLMHIKTYLCANLKSHREVRGWWSSWFWKDVTCKNCLARKPTAKGGTEKSALAKAYDILLPDTAH